MFTAILTNGPLLAFVLGVLYWSALATGPKSQRYTIEQAPEREVYEVGADNWNRSCS